MLSLHERIHERGQHGVGTEDNQCPKQKQHHDKGDQPPFFFLADEQQKFFKQLPHGLVGKTKEFGSFCKMIKEEEFEMTSRFF